MLRNLVLFTLVRIVHIWIPHASAYQYGENHPPLQQDEDIVAAHFPDTDEVIFSPAFLTPRGVPTGFGNGTDGPTDGATLDQFLRSITKKRDWAHYHLANFTSEEGRSFPYVYLSKGPQTSSTGKLRVWVQGGVHGDEPAGDQAVLALLGKLDANETWAASLLEKMDMLLFPRYNPDGVSYFQRTLASNFDPNREHTKLARQQSREIKHLLSTFAAHITIDMHEFTGTRVIADRYKPGMDALIAPSKNLNVHRDIRNISETLFVPGIAKRLEAGGFRWDSYFTFAPHKSSEITLIEAGSDAKAGRNNYGLLQSITILNEVRGIRLADQHFQRRVATALTMVSAILDIAHEHAEEVYHTVENAIEEFIESDDPIVVTDYENPTTRNVPFIDVTNGSLVQLPVNWLSTTPTTANLTRARPEAYLIPRAWADLVPRLRSSGVVVETLDHAYHGTVEALKITSASVASAYYEGAIQVTVTTEACQREVTLPPGSFLVSTRQKNAAMAFVTLEPENIDSYVRFNIIPVREGDEYPIFRVPASTQATQDLSGEL